MLLALVVPSVAVAMCSDCILQMRSDDVCNVACNIIPCNLDSSKQAKPPYLKYFESSDCLYTCLLHCDYSQLENGVCNQDCNTGDCAYDLGDCGYCAPGCFKDMLGNGVCEGSCNNLACDFDGSDCDCAVGCTKELLTNGRCDSVCNSPLCSFDQWSCSCASGCSPLLLGNGICNPECSSADCLFDQGDCVIVK
mmetsp:Transcript_16010/g.29328  ORF Transcript_16010/g.29328 Transcript_16010/m.29328 type:complete len:194 (-) Transcript_16010:1056-1637(-)